MVRVITQGFSTPRSRHSSGEDMIDRFAAMKSSLSVAPDDDKHSMKEIYESKRLVIDCNTDTNDSCSGLDSEEESRISFVAKDLQNNNSVGQDPSVMKRERRRERNKISAQSYRQRRRQQNHAAQKTLEALETHNKALLEKVRQLEAEKHIVEDYLRSCVRNPWSPQQSATTTCPCTAACANSASICACASNINNNNCNTMISSSATQDVPSTRSYCTSQCNASSMSSTSANFTPTVTPSSSSSIQSGFACNNFSKPDNFMFHQDEIRAEPLNMVMEKNNNMPLCMPDVSMTSKGSLVS